jgi:hypothetical protein
MNERREWKRLAGGAAAGLAGTVVIETLLQANRRWAPQAAPPLEQEPGAYLIGEAEEKLPSSVRHKIPQGLEASAGQMLGLAYGVFFGALYPLLAPRGRNTAAKGATLGSLVWALGYLGWLPALKLMKPVWRQRAPQALVPLLEHVAYGICTATVYDWLRRKL